MTAINFDRDLTYMTLANGNTLGDPIDSYISSSADALTTGSINVNSANIHRLVNSYFTLPSFYRRLAGVLFDQPLPNTRSVYRIKGHNNSWTDDVLHELVVGVGPSAPDGTDNIIHMAPLWATGRQQSDFDLTVCIDNFGTINAVDLSDRPIFFGVSIANVTGSDIASLEWSYQLSVQRLAVKNPSYESALR